jgi:hypothetical protein
MLSPVYFDKTTPFSPQSGETRSIKEIGQSTALQASQYAARPVRGAI